VKQKKAFRLLDMKKIELEIVALSHSITQTHSYAVVLGEVNGIATVPIVIGGFEAQAIAVALEKMQPSRPLTHDLMKNFMNAFNIDLHEIIISDLQEGIFTPSWFVLPTTIRLRSTPALPMHWPLPFVSDALFIPTSISWTARAL
jgi:bifunctional DNase/RNase